MKIYLFTFLLFLNLFSQTVLVTGGAGYIGSHTCKELAEAGYYPITIDNLSYGSKDAVKWGPLVIGDITDEKLLDTVFEKYKPEAVIHFAALKKVGESVKEPVNYYETNVSGTVALLKTMQKFHVNKIIFSSTSAVYNPQAALPFTEESEKGPINPYSVSKLMCEKIIEDTSYANGLNYGILRYFNAAGMDGKAGLKRLPCSNNFLISKVLSL